MQNVTRIENGILKQNRNVLRKWFDFTVAIVYCLDTSITRNWKFEFNSSLIYVRMVEPQSCVQYVHMWGKYIQSKIQHWGLCHIQINRKQKKKISANDITKKKSIIKMKLYFRQTEKYGIYANSNQILNANVDCFHTRIHIKKKWYQQ